MTIHELTKGDIFKMKISIFTVMIKNQTMKKILLLILLCPIISYSQRQKNETFNLDVLFGIYSNFDHWKESGVSGGFEFSYNRKSWVYSANILYGLGVSKNINTQGPYIQAFFESDLLIGKQINLTNTISFIPQIGIGYIHLSNNFQDDKKNLIGLPIQTKFLFQISNKVSLGFVPHVNINRAKNNYLLNLTVNVKF